MLSPLHSQPLFSAKKKQTKRNVPPSSPARNQANVAEQIKPVQTIVPSTDVLHLMRLAIGVVPPTYPVNSYASIIDPTNKKLTAPLINMVEKAASTLKKMPQASRHEKAIHLGRKLAEDANFAQSMSALTFDHSPVDNPSSFVIIIPKPEISLSDETKQYYAPVNSNKSASKQETQQAKNKWGKAELELKATQKHFDEALKKLENSVKGGWLKAKLPAGCVIIDVDDPDRLYYTSHSNDVWAFKKKQKPYTRMRVDGKKIVDGKE